MRKIEGGAKSGEEEEEEEDGEEEKALRFPVSKNFGVDWQC